MARAIIENLADAVVANIKKPANKRLNKTELLDSVGYSHNTAKTQQERTLTSPALKKELIIRGFSEDTAKEVVGEILLAGTDDSVKLRAADLIFKVQGSYAPEKSVNMTVGADELKDLIQSGLAKFRVKHL